MPILSPSKQRVFLVQALLLCALFSSSTAHAKPPKLGSVYVFSQGQMIGYTFEARVPYKLTLMFNAAHQLQWMRFSVHQVRLLLTPQGQATLEQAKATSKMVIGFDSRGQLANIGTASVGYDTNGRINKIGKTSLTYAIDGHVATVGHVTLHRGDDRRIEKVGPHRMQYRAEGRLKNLAGLDFTYRADSKITSIGKVKLIYHPYRNLIKTIQGSDSRANIHFLWHAIDIYRLLRSKKK